MKNSLDINRILLVRLSALGDCLAAVPVFYALREAFPQAHLAWAIQDNFAPLIRHLPGLDECIIFPRKRWLNTSDGARVRREFRQFARHVRHRRFDLTVDTQSNSKSAFIAWLTRAPIRIGHGEPEAKEISAWLNNRLVSPPPGVEHILQRNLNLLSAIGIHPGEAKLTLPQDKPAAHYVEQWLKQKRLQKGEYVLLVPFSAKREKEWPAAHFSQLAVFLAKRGVPVVFLNSPGQEAETQSIMKASNNKSLLLAPKTNILQLVELVRRAACVVGGDTGPVQIAGACRLPTMAFFGPTEPKRSLPPGGQAFSLDESADSVGQVILDGLR